MLPLVKVYRDAWVHLQTFLQVAFHVLAYILPNEVLFFLGEILLELCLIELYRLEWQICMVLHASCCSTEIGRRAFSALIVPWIPFGDSFLKVDIVFVWLWLKIVLNCEDVSIIRSLLCSSRGKWALRMLVGLFSADEHSIRRRIEASLLAPQLLVALPKVILIWFLADLVRMREWVDNIGLRIVFDIFLDVLLGDIDVLWCVFLLVLLLEVTVVFLWWDKPDCYQVVKDYDDQEVKTKHVGGRQTGLLAQIDNASDNRKNRAD